MLGTNLNLATSYSEPGFFMGHKKELIDFTIVSLTDISQLVRSIAVTWTKL